MTQLQFEKIAKKIKDRRESMDMSYQKLSDLTGLSKSTLQRYETGGIKNIPIEKLRLITDALRISLPELINDEKEIKKCVEKEKTPTFKWVARNIEEMNEEQLKKLQGLMKIAFDNLYKKN